MSTPRLGASSLASQSQRAGHARPGDWAEVLSEVPIFASLSKRHLHRVAGLGEPVRYPRHTRIVRQGDRGDAFYVLIEGDARVLGSRRRIRLRAGDFFGEMALLDGAARSATIEADTEVLAIRIARRPFLRMLESEPKIALAILRELGGRLRRVEAVSTA